LIDLKRSLELVRARGARHPALGVLQLPLSMDVSRDGVGLIVHASADEAACQRVRADGWRLASLASVPDDIDAIVVVDVANYPAFMRAAESLMRRGMLIVPATPDAMVPSAVRQFDAMEAAWQTSADANYVARCALKGHYLEFGTWYGRSFLTNYFRYRHWLRGTFYGFDSFAGLSTPHALEGTYTGGDFSEGAYCCNLQSFEANLALAEVPSARVRLVPGFYGQTLQQPPSVYGLEPESVSVCVIDCDLREPTEQVLAFVTPLLEPGALMYFDDWRLTRGSAIVGERAAALAWLAANPEIELVEFHRDLWQHQWFIYQRRHAN
jgi:predicted O-methyltransferase YrrM